MSRIGRLAFSKKLLLVPPVAAGFGLVALAVANRKGVEQAGPREAARALAVAPAGRAAVTPKVVGYGTAQPARLWRAVTEIDGRVTATYPNLKPGEAVGQGELLVKIDPTDYRLAVERLQAEARALEAQIAEAKTTLAEDREMLKVEEESLALAKKDADRYRRLAGRESIADRQAEERLRNYLSQKRQARELRKSVAVAPAKIDRLGANLESARKQIEAAERDLGRTAIKAPFRVRLASVAIEPGQYVKVGETLFEAHGTEAAEVEARLPYDDLTRLAPDGPRNPALLLRGLRAAVRVRSGEFVQEWPAELVRVRERVDRKTRTLGVVVRIDLGGADSLAGPPPLLEGTFCEVEFTGKSRPGQLVVPRAAVRNGQLYVVNGENRLERRRVRVLLRDGVRLAVAGDLEPGERVVVTDPTPAVVGMLVKPVDAEEVQR